MQKYINVEPIPTAVVYEDGVRTDDKRNGNGPDDPTGSRSTQLSASLGLDSLDSSHGHDGGRARDYSVDDSAGLSESPQFGAYRSSLSRPLVPGLPDEMIAPLQSIQSIAGAANAGLRRGMI